MIKIKDYLEKYPQATLKEYYNYYNSEKDKEDEQLIKIYNWHKSIDGKYFKLIINTLNSKEPVFYIFKYTCPPKEFFINDNKYIRINNVLYNYLNNIDLFNEKSIYRYELCCPFDKTIENTKIIEISEEDFNKYYKIFKTNIKQIKNIFKEDY